MPIWVQIDSDNLNPVRYPYGTTAWDLGPNQLEVRSNGTLIAPKTFPSKMVANGLLGGSIAPPSSPRMRLPLHISYSLKPGTYEVRYTRFGFEVVPGKGVEEHAVEQSDWTELTVLPYSEDKRRAWQMQKLSSPPTDAGLLIGDTIPELLADTQSGVLQLLLATMCNRQDVAAQFARDTSAMFTDQELAPSLLQAIERYGPSEEAAYFLSWHRKALYPQTTKLIDAVIPFLLSDRPEKVAGGIKTLGFIKPSEFGFPLNHDLAARMDNAVMDVSDRILTKDMETAYSPLAEYLGGCKPNGARELLWRMIHNQQAYEQSLISIAWLADVRDLPALASELLKDDPLDRDGGRRSSVLYQLPRQYGTASYPYIVQMFVKSDARFVRSSAEEELARIGTAAFPDLATVLRTGDASAQTRVRGFIRLHFPEMQSASDDAVLRFVELKRN